MTTCKDCIHYEVCGSLGMEVYRWGRKPTLQIFLDKFKAEHCTRFKPSSRFVELPANSIMYGIIDGRVTELLNLIVQPGDSGMCVLSPDNINKTIFSTKEQAEQALKE